MGKRQPSEVVGNLRAAAGDLYSAVEALTQEWLRPVRERLSDISQGRDSSLRPKLVNDPVWSTLELADDEVLLLDSPLIQRMRGVRQLGLAHLVFPGANHDRFEHICGVVESSDRMFRALQSNISARNKRMGTLGLPDFSEKDRKLVRLAALLHDVGHGPFSHAVEPVIERRYSKELRAFTNELKNHVHLDAKVAAAEAIAALITMSESMAAILRDKKFAIGIDDVNEHQLRLAILILGARSFDFEACFSAIISSQVDSDKLDYMARDALHTGMPIAFDTERLIKKLEVVQCTADNLPSGTGQATNVTFARSCPTGAYSDIAVTASGVGALEQMLIGRAFLYDRLYHHHKVRAADAMAQRLIHFAEQERGRAFDLHELYVNLSDDSMIRVLGGELTHTKLKGGGSQSASLATAIIDRDLYHRAFAFRANFHAGFEKTPQDPALAEIWAPISTDLSGVEERLALEEAIFSLAKELAGAISDPAIKAAGRELTRPHVVVDLSDNRVKPVTINVHVEDGSLEEPNLFFDPSRWSNVYDLQKRTGYVFAPRQMVSLVGLAAAIVFFERWGYAGSEKGRRLVKTGAVRAEWIEDLSASGLIDHTLSDVLSYKKSVRLFLRSEELKLPDDWHHENPDLAQEIADQLRVHLPQGLSADDLEAVRTGINELAAFVDMFFKDSTLSKQALSERDLQTNLLRFNRSGLLAAAEGTEFAGGETDVILNKRCLIENKVDKSGQDPLLTKPEAPYQANRYGRAISQRVFFTLLAYKAKSEADVLSKSRSVVLGKLDGLKHTAVEIRFVVPMGLPNPSRVKKPRA